MQYVMVMMLMMVTILGPSAVIATIGYASIQALGRNPSSAPKIMMAMITALIFAEALAIVALLLITPLLASQLKAM
jgi:F0F1-type ATP synthase membrane subunit c/vacuolar-type H+-ATPase subunit K